MKLQEIDKPTYRSKQRRVALVLASVFLVLGMSLAAGLRAWGGNAEGENMMLNMAGVLLGLVITGGMLSLVSGKPYFDELRYAWNLKKQVLKIQNKKHIWRERATEGNQTAATVMAFYYAGVIQLQHLENNEFGQKEMAEEREAFEKSCASHNLTYDPQQYTVDMLLEIQ